MPRPTHKRRIVLLDTLAIIHRAYHALPDFTGPSGEPTGALYGLVSMILRTLGDLSPSYIAACFDTPKPTVRHEAYAGYKATRAKTDDSLVAQIRRAPKVFEAFSIPIYEREGFEADDILGTIAHKLAGDPETEVIIASGDMDMLQLVDDGRVKVYTLRKGINDTMLYDAEAVEKRYGFGPAHITDYKGLRGDPSDNIKGIPGVGEITATELIKKFGSIENIYKTLKKDEKAFEKAKIKPRIIELLKKHKEDAEFSKMIATIRVDAPIAFQLPSKHWRESLDRTKAAAMLDELGFRSLKGRLSEALGEAAEREEAEEPLPEVDQTRLKEAAAMLWLLASDFTNPTLEDVLAYTKERDFDAAYKKLEVEIAAAGRVKDVYEKIEKPLIPVLEKMREHGVLVDEKILKSLEKRYGAELKSIEERVYKAAGHPFNISSPKQLGEVLFDEMGLTPERQKKTAGGQRSTRESELEKLRDMHPIIGDVLEYRELTKLLSTYIENLPPLLDKDHRLHAEFLQAGTTTGRMASQNPNLQNIPLHSERGRAIRNAFIAPKGFVLAALDYSQIELRLAAILSGDEKLCEIFRSGRDVHQEVASYVFHVPAEKVDVEMRRRAKVINFGILYGMGVNALRAQLGTTTAEAHAFYDEYFGQFKTLAQYLEKTKGFARKHGYTETLFGRRRQFPEMKSQLPYVRAQAERMAINAPMQGTQSDIIKLAMVEIDETLEREGKSGASHLLLQVHDELVYEIEEKHFDEIAGKIKKIMESIVPPEETHNVPIIATLKKGANWGEMQSVLL